MTMSRQKDGPASGGMAATAAKYLFYLAALALSLVSLVTTFKGFSLFVGDPLMAFVIALPFQAFLFVFALPIARDVAERYMHEPVSRSNLQRYSAIAGFLFLLFVSSWFSYLFYFQNMLSLNQGKLTDETKAMELSQSVLPDLFERVRAAPAREAAAVLAGEESKKWLQQLSALKAAADDPQVVKAAAANLAAQREAARARITAAEAAQADLARVLAQREKSMKRVEELKPRLEEVKGAIADLERQATVARQQAADEKAAKGPCRTDPSPKCSNELKAKAARLTKEVGERRQEQTQLESDLKAAETSVAALAKSIADAERIISATTPADRALLGQTSAQGAFGGLIGDAQANYQSSPSLATFENLAQACALARQSLAGMKEAGAVACENAPLRAAFTQLRDRSKLVADFESKCSNERRDEALKAPLKGETEQQTDVRLRRAQEFAKRCIDLAPGLQPVATQELSLRVTDYVKRKDASGDALKNGLQGFSEAPWQAIPSFALAVTFDLFILLFSCVAEIFGASQGGRAELSSHFDFQIQETDNPLIKARKAIIGLARENGRGQFEISTGSDDWLDAEALYGANLVGTLRDLQERGLATSAPSQEGVLYTIGRNGYAMLQRAIVTENARAAAAAAAAPAVRVAYAPAAAQPVQLAPAAPPPAAPAPPRVLDELRARSATPTSARRTSRLARESAVADAPAIVRPQRAPRVRASTRAGTRAAANRAEKRGRRDRRNPEAQEVSRPRGMRTSVASTGQVDDIAADWLVAGARWRSPSSRSPMHRSSCWRSRTGGPVCSSTRRPLAGPRRWCSTPSRRIPPAGCASRAASWRPYRRIPRWRCTPPGSARWPD
ncbi:MAG: hypothetical protein U1E19_10795 [Rhodoblastus sp.]